MNFLFCWSSCTLIRHIFSPTLSKGSSSTYTFFFENMDSIRVEEVGSRYNDYINGSQYKICTPVDGATIHYKLLEYAQTMVVRISHPYLAPSIPNSRNDNEVA
jgi:hypothetical protein